MAVFPSDGYWYRFRCTHCGFYTLSQRCHAATCSPRCRQARKRLGRAICPHFVEDLGWRKKGERVSGKLEIRPHLQFKKVPRSELSQRAGARKRKVRS